MLNTVVTAGRMQSSCEPTRVLCCVVCACYKLTRVRNIHVRCSDGWTEFVCSTLCLLHALTCSVMRRNHCSFIPLHFRAFTLTLRFVCSLLQNCWMLSSFYCGFNSSYFLSVLTQFMNHQQSASETLYCLSLSQRLSLTHWVLFIVHTHNSIFAPCDWARIFSFTTD